MYCECGCGKFTSITKKNETKRGYVKGKPKRFLPGHNCKVSDDMMRKRIYAPECSRADTNGYARTYHVAVEKASGKPLNDKVVVHHHNLELVVCENQAYHRLLHQRTAALLSCGNANWIKCVRCHKYDDPINLSGKGKNAYHKECAAKYQRERKVKK
jgi:hypothetical protein